jgi:hypothetical protein
MRPLSRLPFLAALMTLGLAVEQIAAQTNYYGVVQNLRFGCAVAPYQGRESLYPGLSVGAMVPGFDPPVPTSNKIYAVSLDEGPGIPGSGRDRTITGIWATGGADTTRSWASEPGATLVGWKDDSIPHLPPSHRRCGAEIYLRGTGTLREVTTSGGDQRCAVDWVFQGQERDRAPRPPSGHWSKDPARVWLRIQGNLAANCSLRQLGAATTGVGEETLPSPTAVPEATLAVTPCAAATLCLAPSASAAPELLVRSHILPGGRVAISYLPIGVGATEVWSLPVGAPVDQARSWFLAEAPATGVDHAGFVDLAGYEPPATRRAGDAQGGPQVVLDADTLPSWEEELRYEELQGAAPTPPAGPWISTPGLPGFRFKGRLGAAALVRSSACPRQTLCLGASAGNPAQVVARVTARQSNGKRWVLGGKFDDAAAQLWVQQVTSGPIRYYALAARPANSPWLPALADRLAFNE